MENALLVKLREGAELSRREQVLLTVQLSVPAILAQLSSIVMQYADSAMVGRLGAIDSASIGLISTTTWLMNGVTMAMGTGFTVQVAHRIGAGKPREARDVIKHGLVFALLFSFIMMAIGIGISKPLPLWLGGEPEVCVKSSKYFFIVMCGIPVMLLRYTCSGMLQASGNIKMPSILNIFMCMLNTLLNFFLIFPSRNAIISGREMWIPGAGLGVSGAALGTVSSEALAAVILLFYVFFVSPDLKLRKGESTSFDKEVVTKAVKIAIPIAVESAGMSSAHIAFTKIAAGLGTIPIAANSFALSVESICFMPSYGVQVAVATLVGQSIGAKRKDMANRLAWLAVGLGMAVITVTATLMYIFSPFMLALLTPVKEIQLLGVGVLRAVAIAEPFYCATEVSNGAFRGVGDTLPPSLMLLGSMWIIRIPLAIFLAPRAGLVGMWTAMAIELIIRGVVFLIRLKGKKWLNKVI